jgi:hypothetical protein
MGIESVQLIINDPRKEGIQVYRLRISLPKGQGATYRNLDVLHDALIGALVAAGAKPESVVGREALPWHFAALGWRRDGYSVAHTLVVGTPNPYLARVLEHIDPTQVVYARASTAEAVSFHGAIVVPDLDPVGHGQTALGVVMLSPLAISRVDRSGSGPRWYSTLEGCDVAGAINKRLSRFAGRVVDLKIEPDRLYMRISPRYDTLIRTKEGPGGKSGFVIGMLLPLVLLGHEEDLRLAWYAGLGEKNRYGFGAIGLAERGIGR